MALEFLVNEAQQPGIRDEERPAILVFGAVITILDYSFGSWSPFQDPISNPLWIPL